jgi:hypothetical protein
MGQRKSVQVLHFVTRGADRGARAPGRREQERRSSTAFSSTRWTASCWTKPCKPASSSA